MDTADHLPGKEGIDGMAEAGNSESCWKSQRLSRERTRCENRGQVLGTNRGRSEPNGFAHLAIRARLEAKKVASRRAGLATEPGRGPIDEPAGGHEFEHKRRRCGGVVRDVVDLDRSCAVDYDP